MAIRAFGKKTPLICLPLLRAERTPHESFLSASITSSHTDNPIEHLLRYSLWYGMQLMTQIYYRHAAIYLLTTIISKSISPVNMLCQLLPTI